MIPICGLLRITSRRGKSTCSFHVGKRARRYFERPTSTRCSPDFQWRLAYLAHSTRFVRKQPEDKRQHLDFAMPWILASVLFFGAVGRFVSCGLVYAAFFGSSQRSLSGSGVVWSQALCGDSRCSTFDLCRGESRKDEPGEFIKFNSLTSRRH